MISRQYIIEAAQGMHARPATLFIKLAKSFSSSVKISKGEKTITANSLLNLLSLSLKQGDVITLEVEGDDENEAADALGLFFSQKLKDL